VITLNSAARGASEGMRPGVQALERINTLYLFKKRVFQQKFRPNMPENAYFFRKKAVKSPQHPGALPSNFR